MAHFDNVGLYDALFVMQDHETKTLWNHITGEALYGPMVGSSIGPIGNLFQLSVEQALLRNPAMPIAISDRPYSVNGQQFGLDGPITGGGRGRGRGGPELAAGNRIDPGRGLGGAFANSLGAEDSRLERMELGLGIVTTDTVRFYTMDAIRENGALLDEVDGRSVIVYMDQSTFTPAAMFVDASTATMEDRDVRLDSGAVIRDGVLYDAAGDRVEFEQPQQLFSRWYGFAMTFPGPEIFGQ